MIYFERHIDNSISKFDVSFDPEVLESICSIIMTECRDTLHHVHKLTTEELNVRINGGNCHNLVRGQLDPSTGLIEVSYDEYKYPKLVTLVQQLLSGDASVIGEIARPIETGQRNLDDIVDTIDMEINNINNRDVEKKIRKLEELRAALARARENKREKRLSRYYDMVYGALNMNLLGVLSSAEVEIYAQPSNTSTDSIIEDKQK